MRRLHVPDDCLCNGRFEKKIGHEPIPTFPEESDELPYFFVPGLELEPSDYEEC